MKSNHNQKKQKTLTQVLIIEDQRDWRDHFFNALRGQGFEVAKASNLQEARFYLRRFQPYVVILDMHLGSFPSQGWVVLEEMSSPPFRPQIIVVTDIVNTPEEIARLTNKRDFEAYEIFCFLWKPKFTPQLFRKIVRKAVDTAEDLMKGIPASALTLKNIYKVNERLAEKNFEVLTQREYDVLERLIPGDSNSKIAIVLGLDVETIKTHVKKILAKFLLDSRGKILPFVIKMGLIE